MSRRRIISPLPPRLVSEIVNRVETLPEGGELIHQSRNQSLCRLRLGELDLAAKLYRMPGLLSRLVAMLGGSRPARSYRSAQRILAAGLHTPNPLLVLETGRPLPRSACLVTSWQDGSSLRQFLRDHPAGHQTVLDQVAELVRTMHAHRISHGDLHAANLIVSPDRSSTAIVDLDGTRRHLAPFRHRRRFRRDRARLLGSLGKFPEFAQRLDAALPPAR